MKGNREQIYEFVKLHSSVNANHGISTNEIAEALGMQRTNVSTALGELLREGRVKKSSSRPVLYSLTEAFADEEGAFRELVGYDGSLKYAVQLARAALLYPHRGLNVLLIGREGSGRKYMAEVMHRAAVQQGLVAEQAPFVMCDAWILERTMRQRSQNCSETVPREECSRRQPGESCFYIRYSSCQ